MKDLGRVLTPKILRGLPALLALCALQAQASLDVHANAQVTTARPTEQLNIEITVANTDAFSRTGVVLSMTYPSDTNQLFETEFDGDCPSTSCTSGETVTWTLGTIAAGGAVTVDLPIIVATAAADGALLSFAPSATDDLAAVGSDSTEIEIRDDSVYELALADDADPAVAGADLVYRVSFAHRGDTPGVNLTDLTLSLPPEVTFVSATGGGILNGNTVTWQLGFLSPGDVGAQAVRVALDGDLDAGTVVKTTASIASLTAPGESLDAMAGTVVAAAAPLALAIESVIQPARGSELLNHQLTVSNRDPFTRFGVVLRAQYPAGFNQVFESEFEGDCASTSCTLGERVVWSLGDIPAGSSVTVDLVPVVSSGVQNGTLSKLYAHAFDAAGASTRRLDALRIQTTAVYDLSVAENADPAIAGNLLKYTINYGYREEAAAVNNTTLAFQLPVGTTFVSATEGATANGGRVEWPLGFLSPGDGGIRELTVEIDPGVATGTVLEAQADLFNVSAPLQSVSAFPSTAVAASAPLVLSIEANPDPVLVNELANLQLTVSNRDAFTHFGVQLDGRYPQGFNQVFESEMEGDCASTSCTEGERIRWSLGDIPAGGSVSVTLQPVINSAVADGQLINFFAQVADDQGASARRMDAVRVQSDTRYDLALAERNDPALADTTLDYKITYGYRDSAAQVNESLLRFAVPDGASFVSAGDGGTLNGDVVEWPLGFLSPGDGGTREVCIQVDPALPAGTHLQAHAEVLSLSAPGERLRAEADTAIAATRTLGLAMETNPGTARSGDLANYSIIVSNLEAFTRFGVVLTGIYPQDTNQLFETEFDGDCGSTSCTAGERVTWTLGDIPPGESVSVDLVPVIAAGTENGTLLNLYVAVEDDQGAQSRRVDSMRAKDDSPFELTLAEAIDPVPAGSEITYQLTYGYRADAVAVTESDLRFRIPRGASFISADGGGVMDGDTVRWNLGFLSPGDGNLRTVTIQTDNDLTPGTVLAAAAELHPADDAGDGTRAAADTAIAAAPGLSLDWIPSRNNAVPGEPLSLLLSVSNLDAFTRFGVTLEARFPQGVNALSESDFDGDCASTTCTAGERVTWIVGDIPAGGSAIVELPTVAASTGLDGTIIPYYARARDDQNAQTRDTASALFGCLSAIDADCDGISDDADNCLLVPNLSQTDFDLDSIGNACDPDINQDCEVNFVDLGALKAVFFTPDPSADFNDDGDVNFVDLGIMKALFFLDPGPSGIPNMCDD